MKTFKLALIFYILPLLAAVTVAFGYSKASKAGGMHLCNHQYALCTSALCVPQPGDPTKAICFCDVEEGASMSTVPCEALKPSVDSHGVQTVYSTFSLVQATDKKAMRCPNGTPWTWCLNKRCTIDPTDPHHAICICDVKRSGDWMTFGGNCDSRTCETGYWSGAGMDDFGETSAFMMKVLGLNNSPVKWCEDKNS